MRTEAVLITRWNRLVWSVANAGFWRNLTAARTYFVHSSLAAPKDAVVEGVAVGQRLANLRTAGGLGKDETRAAERRSRWRPSIRCGASSGSAHYATARTLLAEEDGLTDCRT